MPTRQHKGNAFKFHNQFQQEKYSFMEPSGTAGW